MIVNVITRYHQNAINKTNTGSMQDEMPNVETIYFKLPFIGIYSEVTQNKIKKLCKRFCKIVKVKLVFTSDKLRQTFTYKDSYPSVLSSKVVYKFVSASCNAGYVGQMHQHLATRIDEHFVKDKKSHKYQHLMSSADSLNAYSRDCFSILHTERAKHQLHIKESLFISLLKPTLSKQKSHQYIISLSIDLPFVSSVSRCYILFYCHTPFVLLSYPNCFIHYVCIYCHEKYQEHGQRNDVLV